MIRTDHNQTVAVSRGLQALAARAQQHVRNVAPIALCNQFNHQLTELLDTMDQILKAEVD